MQEQMSTADGYPILHGVVQVLWRKILAALSRDGRYVQDFRHYPHENKTDAVSWRNVHFPVIFLEAESSRTDMFNLIFVCTPTGPNLFLALSPRFSKIESLSWCGSIETPPRGETSNPRRYYPLAGLRLNAPELATLPIRQAYA